MHKEGPLVLVEDDIDDQEIILSVLRNLGLQNDIKVFWNGKDALEYLNNTIDVPFLILSDINMPVMNGINFKKNIEGNDILKNKCIPFIFISTSSSPFAQQICDLSIQGCFEKGNSLNELNETLKVILKYWHLTKHLT